jgi:hypothetical protein
MPGEQCPRDDRARLFAKSEYLISQRRKERPSDLRIAGEIGHDLCAGQNRNDGRVSLREGNQKASVDTSNPAIDGQFKTGHQESARDW